MFDTRVGDHLVITLTGVVKADDAVELGRVVREYLAAQPPGKARFLVDGLALKVFSPDAAEALLALMLKDNAALDRAAFVAAAGTTASLQLTRMIQQAGSPRRKLFGNLADANAWLGEK